MLFNIGKFYVLCTEIIHLNVKKKYIYIKYVFTEIIHLDLDVIGWFSSSKLLWLYNILNIWLIIEVTHYKFTIAILNQWCLLPVKYRCELILF
jgi:hypothetical protein